MSNITYVKGDIFKGIEAVSKDTPICLPHVCNDQGAWGSGFVVALSKFSLIPERSYRALKDYKLGHVDISISYGNIHVLNMIAQHKFVSKNNPVALRYDALMTCLDTVFKYAKGLNAEVRAPKFGAGLAEGDWNKIAEIINSYNYPAVIYEL